MMEEFLIDKDQYFLLVDSSVSLLVSMLIFLSILERLSFLFLMQQKITMATMITK